MEGSGDVKSNNDGKKSNGQLLTNPLDKTESTPTNPTPTQAVKPKEIKKIKGSSKKYASPRKKSKKKTPKGKIRSSGKKKKKIRRPVDPKIIERLSTPVKREQKGVSASFDDIRHCTFKPDISPRAKARSHGSFNDRLEGYVRKREEQKARIPALHPECTFQPEITQNAYTVTDSTSFMERLEADLNDRRDNADHAANKQLCSFTPHIFTSRFRRSRPSTASFMERTQADINDRKLNIDNRDRKSAARELALCTFHPKLTKPTTNPSFSSFLARMEADLDDRLERTEANNRMLATKPKIDPYRFSNRRKR